MVHRDGYAAARSCVRASTRLHRHRMAGRRARAALSPSPQARAVPICRSHHHLPTICCSALAAHCFCAIASDAATLAPTAAVLAHPAAAFGCCCSCSQCPHTRTTTHAPPTYPHSHIATRAPRPHGSPLHQHVRTTIRTSTTHDHPPVHTYIQSRVRTAIQRSAPADVQRASHIHPHMRACSATTTTYAYARPPPPPKPDYPRQKTSGCTHK
jgi:hypothetical protein